MELSSWQGSWRGDLFLLSSSGGAFGSGAQFGVLARPSVASSSAEESLSNANKQREKRFNSMSLVLRPVFPLLFPPAFLITPKPPLPFLLSLQRRGKGALASEPYGDQRQKKKRGLRPEKEFLFFFPHPPFPRMYAPRIRAIKKLCL